MSAVIIKGASLIFGTAFTVLSASPAQAVSSPVRYTCQGSSDMTIDRDPATAHVELAGHIYSLQRKRSSIGDKYISSKAALIFDGPAVVFVADDQLGVGTCVKAIPVASAR